MSWPGARWRRFGVWLAGGALLLSGCGEMLVGRDLACRHNWNTIPCAGDEIGAHEQIRYQRLTGTITFDGQPLHYDELRKWRYRATTRLAAADTHAYLPVEDGPIVKPVGSGALSLGLPDTKGAPLSWEGPTSMLRGWENRPFVDFRWLDDRVHPTRVEVYDTVAYLQSPDARLKVTEPLRTVWLEPTPELDATWKQQAEARSRTEQDARWPWYQFNLHLVLMPIDRSRWAKAPGIDGFIAARQEEAVVILDVQQTGSIRRKGNVPTQTSAEEIPVRCSALGTLCTPRFADSGYSTYYAPSLVDPRRLTLDLGTGIYRVARDQSIYLQGTDKVYLFAIY
jgi:hypothetical protein